MKVLHNSKDASTQVILFFFFDDLRYLEVEWEVKRKTHREFNKINMVDLCPKVPKQDNSSDCGVYLLQYVESFFKVCKDINKFRIKLPAYNHKLLASKEAGNITGNQERKKRKKRNGTADNPDIGIST